MTTSRYLDSFVRTRTGGHLAGLRLFPNAKEVTESYAARAAALRFREAFPPGDYDTTCIVVGDGSTPRTAATFALQTAWQCHSVDPRMRRFTHRWQGIPRLTIHRARIQDRRFQSRRLVVAAIHSHVTLSATLTSMDAPEILLVAMPCCVPNDLSLPPQLTYDDPDVLSPKRTLYLWRISRSRRY